jgi:CRP-like cAMP-binding protein
MGNLSLPLGAFNQADLDWFWQTGTVQAIAPHTVLVQAEQLLHELYWVLEGQFTLRVATPEGGEQLVAVVEAGEAIGFLAFINARPSVTSTVCTESAQVLALPQPKLTVKLKQDAGFAARFYQTASVFLSTQLRGISALLVQSQTRAEHPLRKVLLVFAELYDSDLDWMVKVGVPCSLSATSLLIEEGKTLDAIYILLDGTLAVFVSAQVNGTQMSKEVARLATGEILGEMSFVEAQSASATVKAVENCLVWALPRVELATKLRQDQPFAARFYRAIAVVLAERLQDRLMRHGYGKLSYTKDQPLTDELEYEDEIDLQTLEHVSLAGVRFDWLLRRVQARF